MSDYTYQPLPPISTTGRTPPYTRILNLFALPPDADPSSPFHAALEIANLESVRPYEALSYTWGTQPPETYIWIGDGPNDNCPLPLSIKPNLALALQFLRPGAGSPPRRLWIDALCIDQSSMDERSRQVAYMRLVYKHCERVVAWIGAKEESEGVKEAFEAAKRLSEVGKLVAELQKASGEGGEGERRLDDEFVQDMVANAMSSVPKGALQRLAKLFEREYFHRTWVVQEIAVAGVAVAKCEELEMGFGDLVSTLLFVFGRREKIEQNTSLDVWYLIFSRNSHVRMSDIPGSMGPLLDMLEQMRSFKATDLRDKIYSVLGICDEGLQPVLTHTHITRQTDRWLGGLTRAITEVQNFVNERNPGLDWGIPAALKPDYSRGVPEVYTDLVRYMISKSPMFLDVLSFVQHHTTPNINPSHNSGDYPSWVPKWFEPKSVSVFRGHSFKAGLCAVPPMSDRFQSRVRRAFSVPGSLILDGFHVGTVCRVSDVLHFTPDGHSKTEAIMKAWSDLLPNLQLVPRPTQPYLNGEPLDVAFCKAISLHPLGALYGSVMADSAMGFRFPDRMSQTNQQTAIQTSEAAVAAFLSGINGDEGSMTEEAEMARVWFRNAVGIYGFNRRVFLTREGHLGLGPMVMREGDEVVVLFRGRMPYVLRRGGARHHVFIGDAYVEDDGIMHGRVTESVKHGRGGPLASLYEIR